MARETEIKLRISDVRAFHRALKRIGARPAGPGSSKVHEENVIFDTPQGGLAKHGQLLRIRTETPEIRGKAKTTGAKQRVVLTFKQPMVHTPVAGLESSSYGSYKIREEIELEVTDPGNLTRIFEGLGMSGWFRYEKYRTTFRLPDSKAWANGLLIELDERDAPHRHSNKKCASNAILFLTMRSTRLINATVTAKQSHNGVNFLSMSAGSELEPGPSWPGLRWNLKMVYRLGIRMISREAQATARAVGWGGFPGG